MNRKLYILLCLLFFSWVNAQLESAHWYFGRNAGLDFTSGTAVPVYDGQLDTGEGCATISDYEGNLLFYTDGITVWNANHQVMPNGNGLLGDPSSTQSGIVIPVPEQSEKYYIITVGADDNLLDPSDGNEGLHFYIVDMDLDNGMGDVEPFDNVTNLLPQWPDGNLSSEKITAVLHPNRIDFWLITHFIDAFYAYRITPNGIQNPVISTLGPSLPTNVYPVNARGYLKASPDGTKVGIAHLSVRETSTDGTGNSYVDNITPGYLGVYDFDGNTGVVSNEQILNLDENDELFGSPYGIEFSPNSELFYGQLDYHQNNTWVDGRIIQYDLSTNPPTETVLADSIVFANDGSFTYKARGALQLGLDERIYHATTIISNIEPRYRGTALSVIQNPNVVGEGANFDYEALPITTPEHPDTFVSYGLPPFVTSFFVVNIEIEGVILGANACENATLNFSVETNADVASAVWDFGNGDTSNELNPTYTYTQPGTYTVSVTITDTEGFDFTTTRNVTIFATPQVQDAVLNACDINNDGMAVVDLAEAESQIVDNTQEVVISYFASLSDATDTHNPLTETLLEVNETDTYFARVANAEETGCWEIAEINFVFEHTPPIAAESLASCDGIFTTDGFATFDLEPLIAQVESLLATQSAQWVGFFANATDAENRTNALPLEYINETPNNQTIFALLETDEAVCLPLVSIDLEVISPPEIITVAPLRACDEDDQINDGFAGFDLSEIEPIILAEFPNQNAQLLNIYASLNDLENDTNALSNLFENQEINQQTLFAWVTTSALCDQIVQFDVIVDELPIVNQEDTEICAEGESVTLDAGAGFLTYQWSGVQEADENQNLNGRFITVTQPGLYSVTVTNQHCSNTKEIEVFLSEVPEIQSVEVRDGNTVIIFATGGRPPLEYSINGVDWQSQPIFYQVEAGTHLAYVRNSLQQCAGEPYPFGVIDVPNVITPNNDGYNDQWVIPGLNAYPGAVVEIYDRYGKQLKIFEVPDDNSPSLPEQSLSNLPNHLLQDVVVWDGYYLGRKVPTTAYWYIIRVPDGRKFTGWLTVKNY